MASLMPSKCSISTRQEKAQGYIPDQQRKVKMAYEVISAASSKNIFILGIGIVSALDFCPDYSGLFAAGTFTASIGLFSEDTGSQILLYLDDVPGPISQVGIICQEKNIWTRWLVP